MAPDVKRPGLSSRSATAFIHSKAVSLGLDAEYQNTYTASLSYTDFFDGKYNTSTDRDFVALSFGVNF